MMVGQAAFSDISNELASRDRAYVRMAFRKADSEPWVVQTLVVDALPNEWGDAPDGPLAEWPRSPFYYNYGHVALAARMVSAGEVAGWFGNPGAEHSLSLAGPEPGTQTRSLSFRFPPLQPTASVQPFPSYGQDGLSSMPWPRTLFRCNPSASDASTARDYDFLIGDDAPFFPDLRSAVFYLLHGVRELARAQTQVLQDTLAVRLVHPDGWLRKIRISPTKLAVDVAGIRLGNSRLKLGGSPDIEAQQRLDSPASIEFVLPAHLPDQVWVVLIRGNRLLDYVSLDARWSPFGPVRPNLLVESGDLETRIQELRFRGEGPSTEFKEAIHKDHAGFLKTVAAFANGEGGVVLLGVEDKTGDLKGITGDVAAEIDRLTDMIRSNVAPEPELRFEPCVVEHRQLIAIFVAAGATPPYGIRPPNITYYVRRGASTFPARQEEIVELVTRSRLRIPSPFSR